MIGFGEKVGAFDKALEGAKSFRGPLGGIGSRCTIPHQIKIIVIPVGNKHLELNVPTFF